MTNDTEKQNVMPASSVLRKVKPFNSSLKESIVYIFSDDDDDDGSESEVVEIPSYSETSSSNDQIASPSRSNHKRLQQSTNDRRKNEITSLNHQSDLSEISILPASNGKNCDQKSGDLDVHNMLDLTNERIVEDLTKSPPHKHQQLSENLLCRICMDVLVEPAATECGHVFCMACLLAAIERQPLCPLCRQKFHIRKIRRLYI